MPSALIAPESQERMRAVARWLPEIQTGRYGFECRLGEPEPAADLCVAFFRGNGQREKRAPWEKWLRETQDEATAWRRTAAFMEAWRDPASLLYEGANNVWLEFDTASSREALPGPSLFFNLLVDDSPRISGDEGRQRLWATMEAALIALQGGPMAPGVAGALRRCVEALSDSAQVFLGVMLARRHESVRLCVSWLDASEGVAYLERIGWPGSLAAVNELLDSLSFAPLHFTFVIDVGREIHPVIGLECFLPFVDPPEEVPTAALLDWLVVQGMCLPEKRAALDQFVDRMTTETDPDLWSPGMRAMAGLLAGSACYSVWRGLSHVKITVRPDGPLEAKAYLKVAQRWMRTG
jgi:hypothetical protein